MHDDYIEGDVMKAGKQQAKGPKQDRSVDTRARLLEASIRCLVESGYGGFSTTRVTELAGVARGAFSHHFRTREDLLLAAIEYLLERTCDELEEKLSRLRPGPKRTERFLETVRNAYMGDMFYAQHELWTAARTDFRMREVCLKFGPRTKRRFEQIFNVAFGRDVMEKTDLKMILFGRFLNMLRGMSIMSVVWGEDFIEPYWKYEKAKLTEEINHITADYAR